MGQNLTQLCREECLRLLRELPRHAQPKILLHTLKANVHALGLVQLAKEIHTAEEKKIPISKLPLERWNTEVKKLNPSEKTWEEMLMMLARENEKTLTLHWHGPHLEELSSLILHLARNTIAHGQKTDLNLWVNVKQRNDRWHVQVRDDAGGMHSHDRKSDLLAGQGVGLNYVREILKCWGGTCGILSDPGVGVTVTLQFPMQTYINLNKSA
jgi:signal transduction histidine kinase